MYESNAWKMFSFQSDAQLSSPITQVARSLGLLAFKGACVSFDQHMFQCWMEGRWEEMWYQKVSGMRFLFILIKEINVSEFFCPLGRRGSLIEFPIGFEVVSIWKWDRNRRQSVSHILRQNAFERNNFYRQPKGKSNGSRFVLLG